MTDENVDLVEREIKRILETMQSLDVDSAEYASALKSFTTLSATINANKKARAEESKAETESHKISEQIVIESGKLDLEKTKHKADVDLKEKQMAIESDRLEFDVKKLEAEMDIKGEQNILDERKLDHDLVKHSAECDFRTEEMAIEKRRIAIEEKKVKADEKRSRNELVGKVADCVVKGIVGGLSLVAVAEVTKSDFSGEFVSKPGLNLATKIFHL